MNKTITLGRLVSKPELKTTNDDSCYTNVVIASNYGYGDQKKTDFIKYTFFAKNAENLAQYCDKGTQLLVEGKLQNSTWVGKDGASKFELQAIGFKFKILSPIKDSNKEHQGEENGNQKINS